MGHGREGGTATNAVQAKEGLTDVTPPRLTRDRIPPCMRWRHRSETTRARGTVTHLAGEKEVEEEGR